MIRPVLVVSLLAVSCPAVAQVKIFELGVLRSDVHTEFGPPGKFFAPMPNRYLYGIQEYRSAAGVWTRIDDVFMRESPTNAYEVHVMYHPDSRQSRLRPKRRVGVINFIVDKPNNHRETLAGLPEAKAICKGGCSLYGLEDSNAFIGEYQILVYPINPSAELLDLGDQVAGGFKTSSLRESNTTRTYGIGIHLKLERQTWDRSPPNWNSKISEVQITPVNLQFELEPSIFDTFSPVKLGTWQPTRR